eukprot:10275464-Alexandrium_andersonii.AAC.2
MPTSFMRFRKAFSSPRLEHRTVDLSVLMSPPSCRIASTHRWEASGSSVATSSTVPLALILASST